MATLCFENCIFGLEYNIFPTQCMKGIKIAYNYKEPAGNPLTTVREAL